MNDLLQKITVEARRIEEDTEYSAKGHYNAAERWSRYHLTIGLPSAVIAAIASGAAFNDSSILAGSLAILSTALITVLTFLKPSERAESHKAVAGQYHALRNKTRLFREIEVLQDENVDALKEKLYEFAEIRDELNQVAPGIVEKDYKRAQREIEAGFSTYKVDKQ
jgi:hypothetical protein